MASSAAYSLAPVSRLWQRRPTRWPATAARPDSSAPVRPDAAAQATAAADAPAGYLASGGVRFWPAASVVALHVLCIAAIMGYRQYAAPPPVPSAISMVAIPAPAPPAARAAPPEPMLDMPLPVVPPPDVQIAHAPAPAITAVVAAPTPTAPAAPAIHGAAPGPAHSPIASADNLVATLLDGQPPEYPRRSRRLHEEGRVLLMVTVGTDGRVQDLRIDQSSGFERLDQAALRAVRSWRWKPFLRNGAPTIVAGLVEIPFVLARR